MLSQAQDKQTYVEPYTVFFSHSTHYLDAHMGTAYCLLYCHGFWSYLYQLLSCGCLLKYMQFYNQNIIRLNFIEHLSIKVLAVEYDKSRKIVQFKH